MGEDKGWELRGRGRTGNESYGEILRDLNVEGDSGRGVYKSSNRGRVGVQGRSLYGEEWCDRDSKR